MRKAQHTQDVKLCIVSRAQVVVCSVLGVPGQPGACCVQCLVSCVQLYTCAMCTLRNVLCAVRGICTKHIMHRQILYVQFTRRNALHCAGCSVFQGPVCFVHHLSSVSQSVCNVRATSKVCNANCANVVRFAVCTVTL